MSRDRSDVPYRAKAGAIPTGGLIGRGGERDMFLAMLDRRSGSMVVRGLRCVGKTALLHDFRILAFERGWHASALHHERMTNETDIAVRMMRIKDNLLPHITLADPIKAAVKKTGFRVAGGRLKVPVFLDVDLERAAASAQDELSQQVMQTVQEIGDAARRYQTGVVVLLDELQELETGHLRALLNAINYAQQADPPLPIVFVATGLPNVLKRCNDAIPNPLSVSRFPEIGRLDDQTTRLAFTVPAAPETITEEALDELVRLTAGYPFFIQTYGEILWVRADHSPISLDDVVGLKEEATAILDDEWFAGRLDGLGEHLLDFLFTLADLGQASSVTDIAKSLGRSRSTAWTAKKELDEHGLLLEIVGRPSRYAFTLPLFGDFLKRHRQAAVRDARGW